MLTFLVGRNLDALREGVAKKLEAVEDEELEVELELRRL